MTYKLIKDYEKKEIYLYLLYFLRYSSISAFFSRIWSSKSSGSATGTASTSQPMKLSSMPAY